MPLRVAIAGATAALITGCSSTNSVEISESASGPIDFGACINDPYVSEYLPAVVGVFGETIDVTSMEITTDSDAVMLVERLKEQGADYVMLGKQIGSADDCGDAEFGELNATLGDLLVEVGDALSIMDANTVLAGDYDSLDRATELLGMVGEQVNLMVEYVDDM